MNKSSKSHQAKQNLRPAGEIEGQQNGNSSADTIIDNRNDLWSTKNSSFHKSGKSLSHLIPHSGKSRLTQMYSKEGISQYSSGVIQL